MASDSEESELIEAKESIDPIKGSKDVDMPQHPGGIPISFTPVPPSNKEEVESLESAQSESLSGDSFRMLSPPAKTHAESSVKEFPLRLF